VTAVVELQALEHFEHQAWERLVGRLGGNPLHLPEVHLGDRAERDLRFLVMSQADMNVACAAAFVSTPHLRPLRGRALELPTAPAMTANAREARQEIYLSVLEGCRSLGCQRLAIGHTWGDNLEDIAPLSAHITETIVDFVLDLTPPLDDVLAGMHKAHRKNTRRAEKVGLTVRAETSLPALEQLRQVQLASAERSATRGQGFGVRDSAYYRGLHERVYATGIGEVLLAFKGDACVAAIAYLHAGTKAITVRSGCTPEGYAAYAMYLLHAALMKRAKEGGIQELNLGGVLADAEREGHPQHGLYEFKQGFGGRRSLRTSAVMDLGQGRLA
jgi:hypothetical protein